MRHGGNRQALAVGALFAAACVLTALLAEFAFRFYAIGWSALSYEATRSVVRLGDAGVTQASRYPGVVYELKPNIERLFKLAVLRTNADGLHDDEYPLEKPSGHFRVAVIGDSQTMASGVRPEDTFHSVLERRFNAEPRADAARYDFINFAVGGYNPGNYRAVLENRALSYSPDLVLVCFSPGNDHDFVWPRERPRIYKGRPQRNGFFSSFIAFEVESLMLARRESNPGKVRSALTRKQKKALTSVFSDMMERAARKGIPLGVVYLARVSGERTADVRAIMEALDIVFIDTTSAFRDIPLSETRIYRTDRHPNPFAHEVFADAIEAPLRAMIMAAGS